MQNLGDFRSLEEYAEAVVKLSRWASRIVQPKYDNDIRESTEEYLHQFSDQIGDVEEIKMAHIKDEFIPRKLNQWLNKSKDLKCQFSDALKDRSLQNNELKNICDEIIDKMKDCPIEDANDKPMSFIAQMHDAEDQIQSWSMIDSNELNFLQPLDVEKGETSSVKRSRKGIVSFLEYYGAPKLRLLGSKFRLMTMEGESSHVRDREDRNALKINTIPEEGDQADDDISFGRVGESELGMIFPVSLAGNAPDKLNHVLGLHPKMDSYVFYGKKECVELGVVNRRSKEMPRDEEWEEAGVVNLIDKNVRLLNEEPNCPNLVILFLQQNRRLTEIPPPFFNRMPSLSFLDLSETRIKALPVSLFHLKRLQILLLRSCVCLDSLPAEVGGLTNMEVLDLLGTDLPHLPKEIGELPRLRHLQLSFNLAQSELVSLGAAVKLESLQGLSIDVHPRDQQWDRVVGDVIKQIGELEKLRYLQFYFPSVDSFTDFCKVSLSWQDGRLRRFKFIVGRYIKRIISRVPEEVESRFEECDKSLRFVNGDQEIPQEMKTMLQPVTAFYLDHHLEIQSLSEFVVSNFEELKFLVVRECPNIKFMVRKEINITDGSFFPNLEYLGLHYLWKLERVWEDPVAVPPGSYRALRYLMIGTCGKLEYVTSYSMLQCLNNLEEFIIEDCESLTSIVREDEMVGGDEAVAPLLPRLEELVLRHLPQLVALGRGLRPSKEIMRIQFCPKFE